MRQLDHRNQSVSTSASSKHHMGHIDYCSRRSDRQFFDARTSLRFDARSPMTRLDISRLAHGVRQLFHACWRGVCLCAMGLRVCLRVWCRHGWIMFQDVHHSCHNMLGFPRVLDVIHATKKYAPTVMTTHFGPCWPLFRAVNFAPGMPLHCMCLSLSGNRS